MIIVRIWGENDCGISNIPPSNADNSTDAFDQIRGWVEDCVHNHDECKLDVSGRLIDDNSTTFVPTRILDVGEDSSLSYIKLVETTGSGLQAHYIALSHCWGSPERRPLSTTTATLNAHLRGIALDALPKTFQDAVAVTRGIGLRYIWIDSLCIVQDDEDDWRRESSVMGSLYAKARLTIAASGAVDSTQGCFVSKAHQHSVIDVPYFSSAGKSSVIHMSVALNPNEGSPQFGPLSQRAWAFQEWFLSRRIVHFVGGGLFWKCNHLSLDQRCTPKDLGAWDDSWSDVIQRYTGCQLTYESDRPIAIQGLVNELQKQRNDRYHLGIWTGDLPIQLLWKIESFQPDDIAFAKYPSWSWFSKPGAKLLGNPWLFGEVLKEEFTSTQIKIDEGNVMHLQGSLKPCRISGQVWNDIPRTEYGNISPEMFLDMDRYEAIYLIQDCNDDTQANIGLAALDSVINVHDEASDELHCLFILASERGELDPLYRNPHDTNSDMASSSSKKSQSRGETVEFDHNGKIEMEEATESEELQMQFNSLELAKGEAGQVNNETTDGSKSSGKDDGDPACVSEGIDDEEISEPSKTTNVEKYIQGNHVYWVLLLRKLPEGDTYRRVGMGMIFSQPWAEEGRILQNLSIL